MTRYEKELVLAYKIREEIKVIARKYGVSFHKLDWHEALAPSNRVPLDDLVDEQKDAYILRRLETEF